MPHRPLFRWTPLSRPKSAFLSSCSGELLSTTSVLSQRASGCLPPGNLSRPASTLALPAHGGLRLRERVGTGRAGVVASYRPARSILLTASLPRTRWCFTARKLLLG